ncbi:hypothetical protein CRUP_025017, partial [Coryphaenoides rupestris]
MSASSLTSSQTANGKKINVDRSQRRPPPPPPIEEEEQEEDQGLLRVVAIYDFIAIEDTDLTLHEDKEGGFVVRTSSQPGVFTVSVYSKTVGFSCIRHYQIKHTESGHFFLTAKHIFGSIPEVITYHQHNAADNWEIDPSELSFLQEVGSGEFGVVCLGKWRGHHRVAIKTLKDSSLYAEDFIEEAKVMMRMTHPQLVQLYGVCLRQRPLLLITEFLDNGCLLHFLRQRGGALREEWLLSTCQDICQGMQYLERHNYIHRDLAARNCLVDHQQHVKVSDFGMTRFVL